MHALWKTCGFSGLGLLLLGLSGFLAAGCAEGAKGKPIPGNLLAGAKVETGGVLHVDRLTDGLGALEGDFWDTGVTAKFSNPNAQVTWDLGSVKQMACGLVQGDNNDSYTLWASIDKENFQPIWEGPPTGPAGMRLRKGTFNGNGRYLRLTGKGGDALYSVGEVAVFETCPPNWETLNFPRAQGVAAGTGTSTHMGWVMTLAIMVAAGLVLWLLARRRPVPTEPPSSEVITTPPKDEPPSGPTS